MTTSLPSTPAVPGRPGRQEPLEPMTITSDRAALPSELYYAAEGDEPKIGTRVDAFKQHQGQREALGTGTVAGYYYQPIRDNEQLAGENELGILVELDSVPQWLQPYLHGTSLVHCLGDEIDRLDLGE